MAETPTPGPAPTGPDTTSTDVSATPASPSRRSIPSLVSAIVLGFLYSYYEWEAISSLVVLPTFYAAGPSGVPSSIWTLLVLGVILPVVIFVVAVMLGRRRTFAERLVLLVVGFAVVGATSLGILDLGGIFSRG